jgi:tripartite-type tricarboxylate transporter receptor subunit TctC
MPSGARKLVFFLYGNVGSTTHLACALLNAAVGLNVTHVPYRGGGPAMADLIEIAKWAGPIKDAGISMD